MAKQMKSFAKPVKQKVTEEDFGFASDSNEGDDLDAQEDKDEFVAVDENGNFAKVASNKLVKSDFDELSSLCAGLDKELTKMKKEVVATPSP